MYGPNREQSSRQMLGDPKAKAIEALLNGNSGRSIRNRPYVQYLCFTGAFNEDATVHQGKKHNYKAIRLYAIKGEPNGTLDIARKTHTEHLADIHQCELIRRTFRCLLIR